MTHPCPRCGRRLSQSGEVTVPDQPDPLPVFQCDECLAPTEFAGKTFEAAFTFAITKDGQVLDNLESA